MSMNFSVETENRMKKSLETLQKELSRIRTGRATPALLDGIRVDSYGTAVPLNQVAAIAVPDPRLITVSPWDKNLLSAVEKAILASDIGLTPLRDKNIIRLPIPSLTEERRKELVKQCSKICEENKVAVRNVRRDMNEEIKKAEKNKGITEDDRKREEQAVQKTTDRFIKQIDDILASKEKEIMAV